MSSYFLPLHTFVGGAALLLSQILLFFKVEPVYSYFYIFAWWSYILLADGIVFWRTGESWLRTRRMEFLELAFWSLVFWLIFEMLNLRLKNWRYLEIEPRFWIRWPGYALAYATVLPGIFETKDLLSSLWPRNSPPRPCPLPWTWHPLFLATGILMLALPLLWPRYFFPLVWGAFVFLLQPVNFRRAAPSLLRDLENGSLREILLLLAAGFICGGLWEFWNFWARAKWEYTIPHVGFLKIFEMPVLGYLGFPPFALSCFVMYAFVRHDSFFKSPMGKVFACLFCILAFCLIDRYTIASWARKW